MDEGSPFSATPLTLTLTVQHDASKPDPDPNPNLRWTKAVPSDGRAAPRGPRGLLTTCDCVWGVHVCVRACVRE